jgi:hypothetical protein
LFLVSECVFLFDEEEEEEEEDVPPRQRSYFVFKIEWNSTALMFRFMASALSFCGFCCQNKGVWVGPIVFFSWIGLNFQLQAFHLIKIFLYNPTLILIPP